MTGVRYVRKSSGQQNNDLNTLVRSLESRYAALGLRTFRQSMQYLNISNWNLIAVIPSTTGNSSNAPLLLADHFDTAFAEGTEIISSFSFQPQCFFFVDIFNANGSRVSVPGADDNLSATTTLLRAAGQCENKPTLFVCAH